MKVYADQLHIRDWLRNGWTMYFKQQAFRRQETEGWKEQNKLEMYHQEGQNLSGEK